MSILEKWSKAIDERDIDGMSELIHDDYEFTLHSAGKILSKQDVLDWVATVSYTHLTLPTTSSV